MFLTLRLFYFVSQKQVIRKSLSRAKRQSSSSPSSPSSSSEEDGKTPRKKRKKVEDTAVDSDSEEFVAPLSRGPKKGLLHTATPLTPEKSATLTWYRRLDDVPEQVKKEVSKTS